MRKLTTAQKNLLIILNRKDENLYYMPSGGYRSSGWFLYYTHRFVRQSMIEKLLSLGYIEKHNADRPYQMTMTITEAGRAAIG